MSKIKEFLKKYHLIVIFLLVIFFMMGNFAYGMISEARDFFADSSKKVEYIEEFSQIDALAQSKLEKEVAKKTNTIEQFLATWKNLTNKIANHGNTFIIQQPMLHLNAGVSSIIGMKYIPGTTYMKLDNGYLVAKVSDAEVLNEKTDSIRNLSYLDSFNKLLKQKGLDVPIMYVNAPKKTYATMQYCPIGMRPNTDYNLNRHISEQLKEYGIFHVNAMLEEAMSDIGIYYKTDHHWKGEVGIDVAKLICEALNNEYGYNIDVSGYDKSKYDIETYKGACLGSAGTNTTSSFVASEDFELYYPKSNHTYKISIPSKNVNDTGKFNVLMNYEKLNDKSTWPMEAYGAFIYGNSSYTHIQNESIQNTQKMLVIKDSFANAVVPYLAETIATMDVIDIRSSQEDHFIDSVIELIRQEKYDNVIFIYSQPDSFSKLFLKSR